MHIIENKLSKTVLVNIKKIIKQNMKLLFDRIRTKTEPKWYLLAQRQS